MGYTTITDIDDYKSIQSVNPFYYVISKVDGYIEEKSANKYSILLLQIKSKKFRQNTRNFWTRLTI